MFGGVDDVSGRVQISCDFPLISVYYTIKRYLLLSILKFRSIHFLVLIFFKM